MKKALLIASLLGALLLTGMGWRGAEPGVPDSSLGLSKTSVFDAPVPPRPVPNQAEPGDNPLQPPAHPKQPPVIPHAVDEFLPIAAGDNQCLDCHAVEEEEPGEPTPIPRSHYVDQRRTPGQVGDQVAGARYVCVSCHVARTDSPPLVANTFGK